MAHRAKNSEGVEFASTNVSAKFLKDIEALSTQRHASAPLINGVAKIGASEKALNPADHRQEIGTLTSATKEDLELAISAAHAAFPKWNATPVDTRATCLERMADLMEANTVELMSICIREAGKTLPDAIAEIREAVDFCRYYAVEGRKNFGAPHVMPGPTGESNTLTALQKAVACFSASARGTFRWQSF